MLKFILLFAVALPNTEAVDTVVATTYQLTPKCQGKWGTKVASGIKLNTKNPHSNRIIAVSRDLLKKYPFHTKVKITGAGYLSGVYRVEDVMAARWRKKIDILTNLNQKQNKFHNVKITKI